MTILHLLRAMLAFADIVRYIKHAAIYALFHSIHVLNIPYGAWPIPVRLFCCSQPAYSLRFQQH
jgi:hypothetical protein